MLKLSRRVEYGLMAVQHIAHAQPGAVSTAKEIAKAYNIPYELVAKVLQRLAKAGIIVSQQGVYGGYTLAKRSDEITIFSVIRAIEGADPALMPCAETAEGCELEKLCEIKNPLMKIQSRIVNMFSSMTLSEIA